MATAAENMRGAGLMVVAMAAFTINDACMRAIAGDIPVPQILFLRGGLTSAFLAALVLWNGYLLELVRLSSRDTMYTGLRSLGEVCAGFSIVFALSFMSLSTFTAVGQVVPLLLTLSGAVFFGERLGWRRLTAIAVGFAGVMLIIRPGADTFHVTSLLALPAVIAITFRDLMSRHISGHVPPLLVAFAGSLAITVVAGAWSVGSEWSAVPSRTALLMATGGACLVVAYLLSVKVMQVGEIGFVAPFRYTGLLWALFLGVVFLGERPDLLTLCGAAVVVGMGGYSLYRERRLAQAVARAGPD